MTISRGMSGGAPLGTFGDWVKNGRKSKGLTLKGLEALTGVSYGAISDWERGRRTPHRDTAVIVANALGLPPEEALNALMADTEGYATPDNIDMVILKRIQRLNDTDKEYVESLIDRLVRGSQP